MLNILLMPFIKESIDKSIKYGFKENGDEKQIKFTALVLKKIFLGEIDFFREDKEFFEKFYIFYPYARILLSFINKKTAYNMFSEFYEKEVNKNLNDDNLLEYLSKLNIDFKAEKEDVLINFVDYTYAKITKDSEKLVNRDLLNGYVYLNKIEVKNFIKRFIGTRVIENLPLDIRGLNKEYRKYADALIKYIPQTEFRLLTKRKYVKNLEYAPPCMLKIINELSIGGKPTHLERFHLAVFLDNLKYNIDEKIEIFKGANNFNENIARYQLEKIKDYTIAKCATLKSLGICKEEDFCVKNKVFSPIDYFFKKNKKRKEDE